MKHVASSLAILVAAFIVGCQDNTLTDPTSNMQSSDGRLSGSVSGDIIAPTNTLALNAVLHVPGNVYNSFVQISGTVTYQATVIPLDPIPPNPQYAVRLNLTANAEVRPNEPSVTVMSPVWYVSGTSDDWVPIPESGAAFLTKRSQIDGRSDGMLLNLRFRITLASVELSSMWLELPRVSPAANID